MKPRCLCLTVCIFMLATLCGPPLIGAEPDIAALIKQLGDGDTYLKRQGAADSLVELGTEALPAVREAKKDSLLERSDRAGAVENRILDNLAWTPRPVDLRGTKARLSDMFNAFGEDQRQSIVFGDPSGVLGTPEDVIGDWNISGIPWQAIDDLCQKSGTCIKPVGISGDVRLCVIEGSKNASLSSTIVNGIKFVCEEAPQYGSEPARFVLTFYCVGDFQRAIFAGSREAFVIKAVTDTGEELKRIPGFDLGYKVADQPYLYLDNCYAKFAPPKKPCERLATIELDVDLVCRALPERGRIEKPVVGTYLRFPDDSEWVFGGYWRDQFGVGRTEFLLAGKSLKPHVVGSPEFFIGDLARWRGSISPATVSSDNGKNYIQAYFASPSIQRPDYVELRYYTRVIHRTFRVVFKDIPLKYRGR